jgi:DNA-binding PadR family transcriptional regulator
MVKRRTVDNLLALAVLSYLTRQPMHPYELGRTLRAHDDVRSIKFNHGSLYMVIRQLARAGLIVAQETSRAGLRPERTVYAITDAGRDEVRTWLRELVEVPEHEYPHFVAALSLIAALPPREVVELLRGRLRRLAVQRAEIQALIERTIASGVAPLFLVEEDYRLALLDAEVTFVERLIERITDPETGWGRLWGAVHGEPAPTDDGPTTVDDR